MKVDNSNLLNKLAGLAGVASLTMLATVPVEAKESLNHNPSIFSEFPYNRSQTISANTQYTPGETSPSSATTSNNSGGKLLAQKTNPSPGIFNEPPYNRKPRTSPSEPTAPATTPPTTTPEVTPTPATPPETPAPTPGGTETPSTGTPNETPPAAGTDGKDVVAALAKTQNGSFKTLTKALEAAGLTDTLKGSGPFTVFAPNDAAFAKLPQDALQDLMKPENKAVLQKILTYHVVQGKVESKDLKAGDVKSFEGGPIKVQVDQKTGVMVNDAKVIKTDIQGSNGVIHVIDNVILPPDL